MARVLLLEDTKELGEVVRDALELNGHGVVWFVNLEEAKAAIPPVGFDVLLCDYELPDGTGVAFLLECAERWPVGSYKFPFTILWSGLDRSKEVAEAGLAVGMLETKNNLVEVLEAIDGRGR